jgi:hypothetical protein
MVTPETYTVAPATWSTRLALFPLMVRLVAPGPAIVRFFVICDCPLVSVMVR